MKSKRGVNCTLISIFLMLLFASFSFAEEIKNDKYFNVGQRKVKFLGGTE